MTVAEAKRSRKYRDAKRGGPPRTPKPCGTRSAALRHRRHNETVCEACLIAERKYQRKARSQNRTGNGTHLTTKETP